MHKRLKFLEQETCFYSLQFGFRLNCSTNNALMSIIENIQTQLDDNKYVAGVFIHLKKAFDTVHHDILVEKLDHYDQSNISLDVLAKQMNKDLLNLLHWLRANKFCLNIQKTQLIKRYWYFK